MFYTIMDGCRCADEHLVGLFSGISTFNMLQTAIVSKLIKTLY